MPLKDLLTSYLPNYCESLLSGKTICFRPMVVAEEKSLLLAKHSEDKKTILKNLINVLSNCCSDDSIKNIKQITIAEFENLFLLLRKKSIGETETFVVKCPETGEQVKIKINLESDLKVVSNIPNNVIKLNDQLAIILKEPSIYTLFKYPNYDKDSEELFGFIGCCIKEIQNNKETINCQDMPEQELIDFVKNLNKKQFDQIVNYLDKISKTYIIANYTTQDGTARQLKISGLFNYFSFFLTI
jgi:hypothetical protein